MDPDVRGKLAELRGAFGSILVGGFAWRSGLAVLVVMGFTWLVLGIGPGQQLRNALLPGASDSRPDGRAIVLAFVGDMSGDPSNTSRAAFDGAALFVQDKNKAGGVVGRPLSLESFDDEGDPEIAVRLAGQISQREDIVAVIGHGDSETAAAAAPIYRSFGLPFVMATATNPAITRDNPYAFRTIFTDQLQARILANYIRSVLGYESVAVIGEAGLYAETLIKDFAVAAEEIALNVEPIYTVSENISVAQRNDIVRRIALMRRLDSVLLVMTQQMAAQIVPLLKAEGVKADLIGTDTLSLTGDGSQGHRPDYMNDMLLTLPFVPDTASASARTFLKRFEERYGRTASWPALFGYDSALLLASAASRLPGDEKNIEALEPGLERAQMRTALAGMDVPERGAAGLTGLLYFNRHGDVIRPVYLGRINRGEMVAASQQLQIIEDPETVAMLREEGENTIEVEDVFLQVTQVVRAGINLTSISQIDTSENTFAATFELWLRYTGDFDPAMIEFPDSVEPIRLGEPEQTIKLGRETYEVYPVAGTFQYFPGIDSVRRAHQELVIRFRHAQRDINRLVFLPDLRAMGAGDEPETWASFLREAKVIDPSTGFAIEGASVSQEIENKSTRGNPLIATVEIPFSAFRAAVEAYRGELSFRRLVGAWLPASVTSWLAAILLTAGIALTFVGGAKHRFPVTIFSLRLVLTAFQLAMLEQLLFSALAGHLEVFQLENLLIVFQCLWWLLPAIWVIFLFERAVWNPMERNTGYPVPSIIKTTINLVILGLAGICMMSFVFGFSLTSIWAASGVLSLILGFALQSLILDAATGLMINLERPFRIGEWIRTEQGDIGRITEMNWRTVRIMTPTNDELIVPNSKIAAGTITNYNVPDNISTVDIRLRVGFDVSAARVKDVLHQAAIDARDLEPALEKDRDPIIVIMATDQYGPEYLMLVHFDVNKGKWNPLRLTIVECIQQRFADAGIRIALPTTMYRRDDGRLADTVRMGADDDEDVLADMLD